MSNFFVRGMELWNAATKAFITPTHINGELRIINQDYQQAISEKKIAGHTAWSKTGVNLALSTSEEDMCSIGGWLETA